MTPCFSPGVSSHEESTVHTCTPDTDSGLPGCSRCGSCTTKRKRSSFLFLLFLSFSLFCSAADHFLAPSEYLPLHSHPCILAPALAAFRQSQSPDLKGQPLAETLSFSFLGWWMEWEGGDEIKRLFFVEMRQYWGGCWQKCGFGEGPL